uniref:BTB domain-containing protein n=1 Tax=Mycena chlorophos TaxID=658473 RepID=A0ABQ0KY76_MYCCL|nr:predicted protein [Mycena chlorophos]
MADAPAPPKRARLIPESDAGADTPVGRSNKYWFNDGSVILQVESTHVQFRVSKGVLAMHSPVFRDMFSLPPPSNEPTRFKPS